MDEDERRYGLCSPHWNEFLRIRAKIQREHGAIHICCGNLHCDNPAREGWWFCSSECRDAFVGDWVDENNIYA